MPVITPDASGQHHSVTRAVAWLSAASLALAAAGCSTDKPVLPVTAPTPIVNRSPVLNAVSVSPSFGVSDLTTFTLSASGSDADGDAITYQWTIGASTLTGPGHSTVISGDGSVVINVTATDGKGGSATTASTVTIGNMTGEWSFTARHCGAQRQDLPAIMVLTQSGTGVSGTIQYPGRWCDVPAGHVDALDRGAPGVGGTIDARGVFNARIKGGAYLDMFLSQGQMDATGRIITGRVNDSGFGGSADIFTMTKR